MNLRWKPDGVKIEFQSKDNEKKDWNDKENQFSRVSDEHLGNENLQMQRMQKQENIGTKYDEVEVPLNEVC